MVMIKPLNTPDCILSLQVVVLDFGLSALYYQSQLQIQMQMQI